MSIYAGHMLYINILFCKGTLQVIHCFVCALTNTTGYNIIIVLFPLFDWLVGHVHFIAFLV